MDVGATHNLAMPELPEVEVTRRSFATRIEGAMVTSVQVGKPLRWPLGRDGDELVGLQVGAAQRRGKYLWLPLREPSSSQMPLVASEGRSGGLLIHLGMSGSLAFRWQPGEAGARAALQRFLAEGLADYGPGRDFPAKPFTSRLSCCCCCCSRC